MHDLEVNIPEGNVVVFSTSGKIIKITSLSEIKSLEIEKVLLGKIRTSMSEFCGNKSYILISIFITPFNVHV